MSEKTETKTTEEQRKDERQEKYTLAWDGIELKKLEPSDV